MTKDKTLPDKRKNLGKTLPTIRKKNIFFKKVRNSSAGWKSFTLFEKFSSTFNLDPSDDNYLYEAEELLKKLLSHVNKCKYDKVRFGILYALKCLKLQSTIQLKERFNCSGRIIEELLRELREQGLIKSVNRFDPKVERYNDVLSYSQARRRWSYFELNFNNENVKNHIQLLDSIMDAPELKPFKNEIHDEERNYYKKELYYAEYLDNEKRRKELREYSQQTQLHKIRIALWELRENSPHNKFDPAEIFKYLSYGRGLISESRWKGRIAHKTGARLGGLGDYMIEQGFIKATTNSEQIIHTITDKCKPPEISNIKMIDQQKNVEAAELEADETFKQLGFK